MTTGRRRAAAASQRPTASNSRKVPGHRGRSPGRGRGRSSPAAPCPRRPARRRGPGPQRRRARPAPGSMASTRVRQRRASTCPSTPSRRPGRRRRRPPRGPSCRCRPPRSPSPAASVRPARRRGRRAAAAAAAHGRRRAPRAGRCPPLHHCATRASGDVPGMDLADGARFWRLQVGRRQPRHLEVPMTTFDPTQYKATTRQQGRRRRAHGTAGGRPWRHGSAKPPRGCWTPRGSARAAACSTSPPAPAGRRSSPPNGSGPAAGCWPPTSPRRSSATRPRWPPRRPRQRRDARGRRRDAGCPRPGSFDAVISRLGLIYFPDQQRALVGMRRAAAGRPRRGHRVLHGRAQPVLLDPGVDHPPPRRPAHHCPASPDRSASASPACSSRP